MLKILCSFKNATKTKQPNGEKQMTTGVLLREWTDNHKPAENLLYKSGCWDQIIFVRDEVLCALAKTTEEYITIENNTKVISTHTSKSVLLPVFHIELTDGTMFTMRYNFHDWKVSVNSPRDVEANFVGLFDPHERISDTYCEGFLKELVYGPYAENKRQFTLELPAGYYHIFTFFWIFGHHK